MPWAKSPEGKFFRVVNFNPDELGLGGTGGVYVIWFSALQIGWVYVGGGADLSEAIKKAQSSEDIMKFTERGSLGLTYVPIVDKYRDRVIVYLRSILKPLAQVDLDTVDANAEPLAVTPPTAPPPTPAAQ